MVGQYVEVSGIVTAVGTQKDAYTAAYYYIQMATGSEYAGLEVFKESHTYTRGMMLTVKGVIRESYGVTELVECFSTQTASSVALPAPVVVSTDTFANGCNINAEKLEGMLITLNNVDIQPCINPLTTALVAAGSKGAYYCQANLEDLTYGSCFDKYKQMWVKSSGAGTMGILEVDNHAVELAVEYVCATGPTTYNSWTSLTGVLTFAYGTWDLIARDRFDVTGGALKTPASVGAAATSIPSILQTTNKYGNADTSAYGPSAVPQIVLGTGEVNSLNQPGFGGYAQAQPGAAWVTGSCPPYSVLDWMDDSGNKTQNLCSCYPPNFYDPSVGQGSGTKYVTVTGIIQAISSATGPFYICDESCPSTGGCMFTYRRSQHVLAEGDKVSMTAKVYAYYGLNQFSYPIDITVITSSHGTCSPTVLTSVAPFTYEQGCNSVAEQLEATEVTIQCLRVVMVGTDHNGDGQTGDNTRPFQVHSCYPGGVRSYHCLLRVEDVVGNTMLVDDGTFGDGTECLFAGDCPGYTGKIVAVGDTFGSISGFVDQRRGSHHDIHSSTTNPVTNPYGGYYGLMPHSTAGFTGWSSSGWSQACLDLAATMVPAPPSPLPPPLPPPPPFTPPSLAGDVAGLIGAVVGVGVGLLIGVAVSCVFILCKPGGKAATAKAVTVTKAEASKEGTEMESNI